MSVPVWPTELPLPTASGYGSQLRDARTPRGAERGVPGFRRTSSARVRRVNLTFLAARAHKAIFDRFLEETTAGGSLPFWMPDPVTDGWPLLDAEFRPILDNQDRPLRIVSRRLCQFADAMPTDELVGLTFPVSFSVWNLP